MNSRSGSMRPQPKDAATRSRFRAQGRRDTAPEVLLRSELHRRGLRYRVDHPLPVPRRKGDIVFPRQRVVVFVDGCFWHGCPQHATAPRHNAEWWRRKLGANVERDRDTDARLADAGWVGIRVWEHEDPAAAADLIEAQMRGRA